MSKTTDKLAKRNGWTHKWKNKQRNKYLKLMKRENPKAATYVDQEQKFRTLKDKEVTEL